MASRETPSRIADLIKLFDSKAASEIKQELLIANQLILSQTNNTSNPPEVSTIIKEETDTSDELTKFSSDESKNGQIKYPQSLLPSNKRKFSSLESDGEFPEDLPDKDLVKREEKMSALMESATNELGELREKAEEVEALESILALQLKVLARLEKNASKENGMFKSLQVIQNLLDAFA